MEVEMKIRGLMMDPVTNMPIVVLKDVGSDSVLPIWVGVYEANAIALEIEKVTTPRPMTHDLIKNVLVGLDTALQQTGFLVTPSIFVRSHKKPSGGPTASSIDVNADPDSMFVCPESGGPLTREGDVLYSAKSGLRWAVR